MLFKIRCLVPIRLICARDKRHGIGFKGRIPWRCPKDMQHFRTVTTHTINSSKQNAVLMGRKTWEILHGRPLQGRLNVCVSSTPQAIATHASVAEAIAALNQDPSVEAIFVVGGVHIYREVLETQVVETIYVTVIHYEFPTDRSAKFIGHYCVNRSIEWIKGTADFDIFKYT